MFEYIASIIIGLLVIVGLIGAMLGIYLATSPTSVRKEFYEKLGIKKSYSPLPLNKGGVRFTL